MDDCITAAAARLLALHGDREPWVDLDGDRPLSIAEYDAQALADAQLERHRRAREGWA